MSIEVLSRADEEADSAALRHRELLEEMADRMVQNRLDTLLGELETPFTAARVGSGALSGAFRLRRNIGGLRPAKMGRGPFPN